MTTKINDGNITLRDYFIAHAPDIPDYFKKKSGCTEMQVPAPEAGKGWVKWSIKEWVEDDMAHLVRWRITYADAMLAAREAAQWGAIK